MADLPLPQDELALRRRARRRLVGAIALALLSVVVLPMIFDSEPKPLGDSVDIEIPGEETPFEPKIMPAAPLASQGTASSTPEGQEKSAPEPNPSLPAPATARKQDGGEDRTLDKPVAPPIQSGSTTKSKNERAEPPADEPANRALAAQGYVLQLGAFGNERYAFEMAQKAKAAGFKVSVVSANGQSRVRAGPYQERDVALAVQAKLKAKGFDSVLLGP